MTATETNRLTWDEFVSESLQRWRTPDFKLYYEALGEVRPSAITVVNKGLLERAIESGLPGIAVAVCDYTREALAFCVSKAIDNVLAVEPDSAVENGVLQKGEPVCIGSTVLEYYGIEENDYFGKMLRYKQPARKRDRSNSINGYPFDRLPVLHRCISETSPTSETYGSLKDAALAFFQLPETVQALRNRASSVNTSVALATSASPYLNIPPTTLKDANIEFEGKSVRITDCLTTGRITGGTIKRGNDHPAIGEPPIIVTSRGGDGIADLWDLYAFLEEGGKLDCIVIEAPTAECIDSMRAPLEDIIDEFKVPIVVFCEEGILRKTKVFDELDFPIFIWGRDQLNDISEYCDDSYLPLTHRELCAVNSVTRYRVAADDGRLSEAARIIYGLADNREKLGEGEQSALLTLTRILGVLLRQTEMIDELASGEMVKRIDGAEAILTGKGGSYSLSQTEMADVKDAAVILRSLCLPDVALSKEEAVYDAAVQAIDMSEHTVCLIVSNGTSERTADDYWKETLEDSGLSREAFRVVTPRRFLKQDCTPDTEEVFISGWFQREEMERLLQSGLSSIYTVFLYRGINPVELETQWYVSADNYWKSHHASQMEKSRSALSRISVVAPEPKASPAQGASRTRDTSLAGLTRSMERERGEFYRSTYDGDETCLGRPVWFTSGTCRWLRVSESGGDSLWVVTDALDSDTGCCRKTANALQEGDIVLRTEAEDDAIDEACRAFGSHAATLSIARSWHKPIEDALRFMDSSYIRDRIMRAGCDRNPLTVSHWINDPAMIAPSDARDIKIIGEALNSPLDDDQIKDIMRAASIIRGDRISSGRKLSQEIAEAFVETARELGSLEEATRAFSRIHGDLGSVELLYVEYVGDPITVPITRFGWFMN